MLTDFALFQMQTSGLITIINLAPNHIRPVFDLTLYHPCSQLRPLVFFLVIFVFQNTTNLSIIRDNANQNATNQSVICDNVNRFWFYSDFRVDYYD